MKPPRNKKDEGEDVVGTWRRLERGSDLKPRYRLEMNDL